MSLPGIPVVVTRLRNYEPTVVYQRRIRVGPIRPIMSYISIITRETVMKNDQTQSPTEKSPP